jgi:hypothetical protein
VTLRVACLLCLTCGLATSTTKLTRAFDKRGQCSLCIGCGRSQHMLVCWRGDIRELGVMQRVVSLWFHVQPWQVGCVWEVVLLFRPQFHSCRCVTSSKRSPGDARPLHHREGGRKEAWCVKNKPRHPGCHNWQVVLALGLRGG